MTTQNKYIEFKPHTGAPGNAIETLNRAIGQYIRNYRLVKIGITGRDPQIRFDEHLRDRKWSRMVVIYETSSINFANTIENWLIEFHWDYLINQKEGGRNYLSPKGKNYAYVLLK